MITLPALECQWFRNSASWETQLLPRHFPKPLHWLLPIGICWLFSGHSNPNVGNKQQPLAHQYYTCLQLSNFSSMVVISLKTFVDSLDIPTIDLDEQDFVRHMVSRDLNYRLYTRRYFHVFLIVVFLWLLISMTVTRVTRSKQDVYKGCHCSYYSVQGKLGCNLANFMPFYLRDLVVQWYPQPLSKGPPILCSFWEKQMNFRSLLRMKLWLLRFIPSFLSS